MSEKLLCPTCGLHFDDEFEDTLKPECKLWAAYNAEELTPEDKKKVWDWWFSAPGNYIAEKYDLHLAVQFGAFVKPQSTDGHGNQFASAAKNWNKMTEKEQREYQREYQKWVQLLARTEGIWPHLAKEFDREYRIIKAVNKLMPKKAKSSPHKMLKKKVTKESVKKINRAKNARDFARFTKSLTV